MARRSPEKIESMTQCIALMVLIIIIGVFCGALLLRPSQRVYGRPTTYRDNVECPTIKRETPKINRANKPKLGRLNKYNLDELDIKNGLGECCYRAFPDGDIYNRETELPDWDRIFEDRHPYWLEHRYFPE